jgi:hypothetical protein
MLRSAFVILTLILLSIIIAEPTSGSNLNLKKPVRILDQHIPTILSSQKTLKSGNRLMQSPGTIIDSTYWDWQRNGGYDDHLAITYDYGTVLIDGVMMVAYQQDTSDRTMRFYHWNGNTWTGHGQAILPVRNGFGSMSSFFDGWIAICTHGDVDGNGTRCWAGFNAFPGLPTFAWNGTSMTNRLIWPRISENSDGSICMTGVSQANSDVWIAKAQDSVSGFSEWYLNFRTLAPNWIDDDMEWPTIHSGTNGKVGVVIPDFEGSVRLFESTDSGESFDVFTIIQPYPLGIPREENNILSIWLAWINSDIMYLDDEPHVVWTTAPDSMRMPPPPPPPYQIYDFYSAIFHWSPSTGIDTVVIAETQSEVSTQSDYVPTPDNHLSVDWPSIGVAVDGRTLVVAYTAFNVDDIDSTTIGPPVGYVDIWMTTSSDNGETWAEPQNVTNPDGSILGWDDRYPSIAKFNLDNAADPGKDVYMIYQSDNLAGTFVQGTEGALNMDYIKFVGIDLATVGIGDGRDGGTTANIPKVFSLSQNYPNPFNPSTTIQYDIAATSGTIPVEINIYDVRGRLVRKLVDQVKEPGRYQVHWNGRDDRGEAASSGIYLYSLMAGDERFTRKMTILN